MGSPKNSCGNQVEIAAELGTIGNNSPASSSPTQPWRKCGVGPEELRSRWSNAGQHPDIIYELAQRGVDSNQRRFAVGLYVTNRAEVIRL